LSALRPYWAILQARYRTLLQYRAAAFAGAGTQLWWGFIRIMIFEAFYLSSAHAAPMSFEALVSYVWLGQAFLGMLPWNQDPEIQDLIRRGDVAYELVRPVDLYGLWYMRTVAMRGASVSLRCLPIFLLSGLLLSQTPLHDWALGLPVSWAAALVFALALGVGLMLSAAITTLVHVSLLWTISGEGMARIMPALVMIFSGMVVPLPLFPDWFQPILAALPFRGICDTPYRIYTGDLPIADAAGPILLSLVWTLALVALGRALLARGHRRVVVQGG
jgi:ABC-2 type transport system permease protein